MVVPRNLNDSTAVPVLFMMVSGGRAGGVSPEVHDHLHGFERVKLQVVETAPDSQLHNLPDQHFYFLMILFLRSAPAQPIRFVIS